MNSPLYKMDRLRVQFHPSTVTSISRPPSDSELDALHAFEGHVYLCPRCSALVSQYRKIFDCTFGRAAVDKLKERLRIYYGQVIANKPQGPAELEIVEIPKQLTSCLTLLHGINRHPDRRSQLDRRLVQPSPRHPRNPARYESRPFAHNRQYPQPQTQLSNCHLMIWEEVTIRINRLYIW